MSGDACTAWAVKDIQCIGTTQKREKRIDPSPILSSYLTPFTKSLGKGSHAYYTLQIGIAMYHNNIALAILNDSVLWCIYCDSMCRESV